MRLRRIVGANYEARRVEVERFEHERKLAQIERLNKRLAWLRSQERPCDGHIDKVIAFWERMPGPLNTARENVKKALQEERQKAKG